MQITPDTDNKRRSLLIAGALVIAFLLLAYWLAGTLFPFAVSVVISYILFPIVKNVERVMPRRERYPDVSRLVAIGLVFVVAFAIVGGLLVLVVPPIIQESAQFLAGFPDFFRAAGTTIEQWNQLYVQRIPDSIRLYIENRVANAGEILLGAIQNAVVRFATFISSALSLVIGLFTGPFFLFYLLKDQERVASGLYSPFPSAVRPHLRNVGSLINQTIGAYLRGQLLLGLVVGSVVAVGLFFMGVDFPILLGLVAGVTELIPIIGPWIGGAAGVLVTLATAPEKVLWVLLLYLVIQVLENSLLVPRIQGGALRLHPMVVMVIIVVGSQTFGLWGIILGPMLVAATRDVIVYFNDEWNSSPLAYEAVPGGDTSEESGTTPSDGADAAEKDT